MAEQTSTPQTGDPGLTAGVAQTPAATPPTPPEATQASSKRAASPAPEAGAQGENGSQGSDSSATEQAKEKAQNVGSKISERATSEVSQRTSDLGQRVGSVASDLREVGGQLEGQENTQAASVANGVADRAERLSSYLDETDGERLLSDIEDLGRRQPWLVLAGGVAAGIAAARLLKASSSDRYQRTQSTSGSPAA